MSFLNKLFKKIIYLKTFLKSNYIEYNFNNKTKTINYVNYIMLIDIW